MFDVIIERVFLDSQSIENNISGFSEVAFTCNNIFFIGLLIV